MIVFLTDEIASAVSYLSLAIRSNQLVITSVTSFLSCATRGKLQAT